MGCDTIATASVTGQRRKPGEANMLHTIYYALSFYAMGLLVYTVASWISDSRLNPILRVLEIFYAPLLVPLRDKVKPISFMNTSWDIAPGVLFAGIIIFQRLIVFLFTGP
jgi:uncharacterized protein YggT (Ycf19 family)